jgi:hypothetical protein
LPLFAYLSRHDAIGASDLHDDGDARVTTCAPRRLRFVLGRDGADIGGGRGTLVAAILTLSAMRAVVFDRVTQRARSTAGAGVARRCDVIAGDFFVSVPEGGDAYFLSQILRLGRRDRRTILSGIRAAMTRQSPAGVGLPPGARARRLRDRTDLIMLTVTGDWSHRGGVPPAGPAGFEQMRVIPTGSEFSIINALGASQMGTLPRVRWGVSHGKTPNAEPCNPWDEYAGGTPRRWPAARRGERRPAGHPPHLWICWAISAA